MTPAPRTEPPYSKKESDEVTNSEYGDGAGGNGAGTSSKMAVLYNDDPKAVET